MAVLNLRPIAGGLILRGSQPFGMDRAETSAFLGRHGIRAVVDLRTKYERAIDPWAANGGASASADPSDANSVHGSAAVREAPDGGTVSAAGDGGGTDDGGIVTAGDDVGESTAGLAHSTEFLLNPLEPRTAIEHLGTIETAEELGGLYLGWVRSRPEWVANALRPVAQGKRTLIHCSLGKDRTGVIAALALLATGADHQAVVADYTATTPELPQMLSLMAAAWRLAVPAMPEQAFSPTLMILQSPAEAMTTFLAGFTREFGDAAAFLRDNAGLSGVEVDALRAVHP
jgi:protein-tyrosine phosphatase